MSCEYRAAAPVIKYSESLKHTQRIKAGESLVLSINIVGTPTPKTSWWFKGSEIKRGGAILTGTPLMGASNAGAVSKKTLFWMNTWLRCI